MNLKQLLLFLLGLNFLPAIGQDYTLDTLQNKYSFVNWKANQIKGMNNSSAFSILFKKFNDIAEGKKRDLHIFHIGGSHIQADIYSNRLRTYLQHMNGVSKGQRGFVYPFKLAKTNNPSNYTVVSDGDWQGYRCSIKKDSIAWGLSGITAAFRDSVSTVQVKANYRGYDSQHYDFNKLRIFYDNWSTDYEIDFKNPSLINTKIQNKTAHYVEYALNQTVEEIAFDVKRVGSKEGAEFLMMGLELMNDNCGIQYTSIGVNGASFDYYNRCAFFDKQLFLYDPDLFIISVGTNDAYHPDFNPEKYRKNYEKLICTIQKANPDCAILLTVPNDSYYKRQTPNPRTRIMQKIIYELSDKYEMAVWDFYEIMGGFNSSQKWYEHKLMPRDRIHFTQFGYRIKADLLLQALTGAWEECLQLEPRSILNQIIRE